MWRQTEREEVCLHKSPIRANTRERILCNHAIAPSRVIAHSRGRSFTHSLRSSTPAVMLIRASKRAFAQIAYSRTASAKPSCGSRWSPSLHSLYECTARTTPKATSLPHITFLPLPPPHSQKEKQHLRISTSHVSLPPSLPPPSSIPLTPLCLKIETSACLTDAAATHMYHTTHSTSRNTRQDRKNKRTNKCVPCSSTVTKKRSIPLHFLPSVLNEKKTTAAFSTEKNVLVLVRPKKIHT